LRVVIIAAVAVGVWVLTRESPELMQPLVAAMCAATVSDRYLA
jgi:hypothetical protein